MTNHKNKDTNKNNCRKPLKSAANKNKQKTPALTNKSRHKSSKNTASKEAGDQKAQALTNTNRRKLLKNTTNKKTGRQKTPALANKNSRRKPSKNPANKKNRLSIHDTYFKTHFSQIEKAKKLLQLALTPQEQKLFNWNSLKIEKDSFPQNKRADLIFSLSFKSLPEERIKIYILLEHKTQKDQQAFNQILSYNNYIIESEFLRTKTLPGILNVICYHGARAWTGRKAFEERSLSPG